MATVRRSLQSSNRTYIAQSAFFDFLAPAVFGRSFQVTQDHNHSGQTTRFSTAPLLASRKYRLRNGNPQRGVSPLRRTGLNGPLSVDKEPLPTPVLDPARRSKKQTQENHPLWGFFPEDKSPMRKPEEIAAHGRPWTIDELRRKSWEDLHSLWWVAVKERNCIATGALERQRLGLKTGGFEERARRGIVKATQKAIKHVLTERWYAWEDARALAADDPDVDLSADGPAYMPYEYEAEDDLGNAPRKQAAAT